MVVSKKTASANTKKTNSTSRAAEKPKASAKTTKGKTVAKPKPKATAKSVAKKQATVKRVASKSTTSTKGSVASSRNSKTSSKSTKSVTKPTASSKAKATAKAKPKVETIAKSKSSSKPSVSVTKDSKKSTAKKTSSGTDLENPEVTVVTGADGELDTFIELLNEHYLTSLSRQLSFGDYLNGSDWFLDIGKNTATFGNRVLRPQLIGSYATGDSTWLWSWANTASKFPAGVLKESKKLKKLGGIFSIPMFQINEEHGHSIAMVASALAGGVPYYRGPYPGGAVFFLLMDAPAEACYTERAPVDLIEYFGRLPTSPLSSHRVALTSFLESQKFDVKKKGARELICTKEGHKLSFTLDKDDFMIKMTVNSKMTQGKQK